MVRGLRVVRVSHDRPMHGERNGLLFAASAAVIYGAAYPATAIALRSSSTANLLLMASVRRVAIGPR